ncbi:MAG: XRE family transcriptional regulator [Candidatus Omnitrophota bacterium]|nr:XRE family transcriptional regulator [Candidatus Omnitrophota bacterium]
MYEEIGKKLREKNNEEVPKGEAPDFAKAIKRLRQDGGLSLEKLSEQTAINKQTLHSIENRSIRNPSFPNLEKIATAVGVSVNDLLLMARAEFRGNLFKTTAAQRWTVSFEGDKGFSVHSYSPPGASQRDFFIGVITIKGGKKLKHWQFTAHAKACIQPWEGDILFTYHGMNWRREERVSANETLYYDAFIPHTFENLSEKSNRVLLVTYPSIF